VFQGAVDATFAAFGIDAVYTPGGEPVSVRVIAKRPDTTVGFGETRIHTETATFEVRASEFGGPRPGRSAYRRRRDLHGPGRAGTARSRSARVEARRTAGVSSPAHVGPGRRPITNPAIAATTPTSSRIQ
jgi:hypothetical protein